MWLAWGIINLKVKVKKEECGDMGLTRRGYKSPATGLLSIKSHSGQFNNPTPPLSPQQLAEIQVRAPGYHSQ